MAAMTSPMMMTSTWEVRRLRGPGSVGRSPEAQQPSYKIEQLSQYRSYWICTPVLVPNVAHLMVNMHGTIRLFHHFHRDARDGLNDGRNALLALLGGSRIAAAMAVDTKQVVGSHIGTPYDWSKMLTWNSMADVSDAIDELMTMRSLLSRVDKSAGQAGACIGASARPDCNHKRTTEGGERPQEQGKIEQTHQRHTDLGQGERPTRTTRKT